jgi:hypothetical protein
MSNFLDIRCPECGNTDQLDIEATISVRVTENGTDADLSGDGYWTYTPKSWTACGACGYGGELRQFEEDVPSHNPVSEVRS